MAKRKKIFQKVPASTETDLESTSPFEAAPIKSGRGKLILPNPPSNPFTKIVNKVGKKKSKKSAFQNNTNRRKNGKRNSPLWG